jgi:hypothetical protein
MLAEGYLTQQLFGATVRRIAALPESGWGRGVCCGIQQKRREEGEVSMELVVGARLASLERLEAVEKCFRSTCWRTFRAETPTL